MFIHISNTTKDLLPATYVTKERGKIVVKGKGEMVTFWMESKTGRAPPPKDEVNMSFIFNHDLKKKIHYTYIILLILYVGYE